ncbi:MAG: DeoR/GlpR transcriptional regulator [Clostridia bacterium]|nr:DeoR/GlpR transcriptional regulator [Clostridia bacterium]
MLAVERKNLIYTKLCEEGRVMVNDLAIEFGVSDETIRRDLDKLAQEGLAEKFYGGAIKAENTFFDLPFHVRQSSNTAEKKKIAELVIPMIHDGDYIALDSSTTALEVIKAAKNIKNLTIITPSVEVMIEFSQKADWNIVSTGGILKTGSLSLVGGIAEKTLGDFNVDLCICSCKGLDLDKGCTESSEAEATIKIALMKAAKRKIMAVDSTKIGKVSFAKVCDISDFDIIVTDKKPSSEWIDALKGADYELLY